MIRRPRRGASRHLVCLLPSDEILHLAGLVLVRANYAFILHLNSNTFNNQTVDRHSSTPSQPTPLAPPEVPQVLATTSTGPSSAPIWFFQMVISILKLRHGVCELSHMDPRTSLFTTIYSTQTSDR
jgi:hypothetical protein